MLIDIITYIRSKQEKYDLKNIIMLFGKTISQDVFNDTIRPILLNHYRSHDKYDRDDEIYTLYDYSMKRLYERDILG